MARSKRNITLAGGNTANTLASSNETPDTAQGNGSVAGSTSESNTMTDVSQAFDPNVNPPPTDPAVTVAVNPQPNGTTDEVDEDLLVGRNSPVEDKRKAYMREIRKLGRDFAGAAASTIGLGEMLLEGTCNDAFTYAKYPNGTVQDDALDAYKLFRMPDKNSPPVDTTAQSFNSNVGMYRNVVFLGMAHKAEAQKWFGLVRDTYERLVKQPDIKKSLKNFRGTWEAVSDVIREQLDRDGKTNGGVAPLLSDGREVNPVTGEMEQVGPDEIFETMRRKDPTADDAVKHLIEAYKSLTLAREGRQTKNTVKNFSGINDPRLADLIEELQDFGQKNLSPADAIAFSAGTVKQKRTRRTIKAPGTTADPNDPNDPANTAPTTPDTAELDTEAAEYEASVAQELGDIQ